MYQSVALASLSLAVGVYSQQAGTSTPETHPSLSTSQCTASGCTAQNTSIVLDGNWRWLHSTSGYTNCYTGNTWDATLCPDATTCATNCALDGADYEGTYGITTDDGALTLKLVTGSNSGSRVYLMDTDDSAYQIFKLKNQEFTFDVDVSNLPCGLNGALYFVEMEADGGKSATNTAGAKYGTGYCDAQCPQDIKFIDGEANVAGWTPSTGDKNSGTGSWGSCCNEMDVWEANSISAAFTPHVCNTTSAGQTKCTSDSECGAGDDRADGICDKDGCDFNSYRMGNHSFYGSGEIVDTSSKFTVVTQFITSDGTATGSLSEIRRIYVQNGKVIQNSVTDISGIDTTNSITDSYCKQQKTAFGDTDSFEARGGLSAMGSAFETGMVLVMSIWDDYAAQMLWLDAPYPVNASTSDPGVVRGTCGADSGVPATVESDTPNASVTFSNIKFGDLNTTYTSS
ncbi:hypothetical protein MBLNU459_g2313t1 [Dothideomycetes sp. NU459]